MPKQKWDKGLDFEETYKRLLRALKRAKDKQKLYVAMAILQLSNGLRSSETVRAIQTFLQTKQLEFEVKVSKKKKEETRLVVIPKILTLVNLSLPENVNEPTLKKRYENWVRWKFGFNTHSLRYAFITYLLTQGINASLIAKITHHSHLDYILTYTQQKTSNELLKTLVNILGDLG